MSEIERLFREVAAYPDTEPVGLSLSYGNISAGFGYNVVRAGDPALQVKEFLFGVLTYCVMNFGSNIDLSKIKSEIFS